MDYQELRRIAGRDAWELIPGYEQTAHPRDRQNVRDCVHQWLADVEEEFPPAEPLTRRELAEHYQHKAQAHIRDANAGDGFAAMHAYSAVTRVTEIARRAAADRDPDADYIAGIAVTARRAADTAAKTAPRG